jgi:4-alpha-glucanotransferase
VSETRPLDRLAEHYGILAAYTDNWGQRREVSDATRRALLGAMGVPVASASELRSSLQRLEAEAWGEVLPPVAVLRAGAPLATLVTVPASRSRRLAWTVTTEEGERRAGTVAVDELELIGRRRIAGRERQRLRLPLPLELPLGYHRLEVSAGAEGPAAMTVIVTPGRACRPGETGAHERSWGVTAPLYGLRSAQSWGIGDFADLARLAQVTAGLGAALVGINPVHALFPALPERFSPYSPSSRRFLNVLMISIEHALRSDWAGELASELARCRAGLVRLKNEPLLDYPAVAALKLGALERLYAGFARSEPGSPAAEALRAFEARTGPSLARHALFDALLERFAGRDRARASWRSWPEGYRSPDGAAAMAFAREHAPRIGFFKFLQWLADGQLGAAQAAARAAGMPIGLYLDLAVGVDPDGADAWAEQGVVAGGVRIGAPPDDFSPKGQDWGLAPLAPHALRRAAYAPFVELLRSNMRHAGALRIDHVLGLRRSYWLPPERDLDGAYIRYPLADLLGLIALESRRHGCVVIGEDLGTVPEDLRAALAEGGLLGCRVLYFEQDRGGFRPARHYPEACLASISTHDLPTLRGFWVGRDIDWRERLGLFTDPGQSARERAERARLRRELLRLLAGEGLLAPELDPDQPPNELPWSVVLGLHRLLARSPAEIVALQLEDALGAVEQANLPGTTGEHPNWRRRLEIALEDLAAEPGLRALAGAVDAERRGIDLDATGAIGDN